jgi:hypothetical protein
MFRFRFLRSAAVALGLYGVLGLCIAAAMLVVGTTMFQQVASLQATLESERVALVQSLRTVSSTLHDTAGATSDFQRSVESARTGADQASALANDSAGTFRELGTNIGALTFFGLQPLAGLAPQFAHSADQLQQLAISLGVTREALKQNVTDIQRVSADLNLLQTQFDGVATSLSQPGVLGFDTRSMLPFQLAFYGMCLLVILQSGFSIVAGIVLYRLQRALGTEALFPGLGQRALPQPSAETKTETESKELSLVP